MFSYDVKIRPFQSQGSTRAFAVLVIDGVLEVQGFKVIEGRNGLFVSAPNTKSNKVDENTGKNIYYDDVRFTDPRADDARRSPLQEEIYSAILTAYNNQVGNASRGSAAAAHTANTTSDGGRPALPGGENVLF